LKLVIAVVALSFLLIAALYYLIPILKIKAV
jgi:hypothetical protein